MVSKVHISKNKIPPSEIVTLERRRKHKIRNNAEIRRRQLALRGDLPSTHVTKGGYDKDYGPNAEKPDVPESVYKERLEKHRNTLRKYQQNRDQIEVDTTGQRKSTLWKSIRKSILTASNFARIIKMLLTTSCASVIRSIIYPSIKKNTSIDVGNCKRTYCYRNPGTKIV